MYTRTLTSGDDEILAYVDSELMAKTLEVGCALCIRRECLNEKKRVTELESPRFKNCNDRAMKKLIAAPVRLLPTQSKNAAQLLQSRRLPAFLGSTIQPFRDWFVEWLACLGFNSE